MPATDALLNQLTAARTRLILDKPFLGALVLRLPLQAASPQQCPTTATDARHFYYNPQYIQALTLEQTQFVLAHEALHCALAHFARRQHRQIQRWDLACDYAINPILVQEGLIPPPGVNILPGFAGMTAEEIYPYIADNPLEQPMDQHWYDQPPANHTSANPHTPSPSNATNTTTENSGDTILPHLTEQTPTGAAGIHTPVLPLTPEERQTLQTQWQQRLAGAAQQALQAGKLSRALMQLVDHLLQPQLPWRLLLARYLTALARDDFNYTRPSRREGEAIFPSLRSHQVEMTVVLDTSGSITENEIEQFLTEINAIKSQLRTRLTLHSCDSQLATNGPWIFEAWEPLMRPATGFKGGGGTDFCPIFTWLQHYHQTPDLLIYFTDAKGRFPPQEPHFPTLWLVKGRQPVPWGQRIQLN